MKMKLKIILIFFLIFLISGTLFGQEIFTIIELISLMKEKYSQIEDYTGKIVMEIRDSSEKIKKIYKGDIFYKSPDKLKIVLEGPDKREIVTNGKKLWIYLPDRKIVGVQNLNGTLQINVPNSKKALSFLTNSYRFSFLKDKNLYDFNGFKIYKIRGIPRKSNVGFKEIILYVRKDGFIIYQKAKTIKNEYYIYYFTYVEFNVGLKDSEFKLNIPYDVEVVENIYN